jgi:hypothetical protein
MDPGYACLALQSAASGWSGCDRGQFVATDNAS